MAESNPSTACVAPGCEKPARLRRAQLCSMHAWRMNRHGAFDLPPVEVGSSRALRGRNRPSLETRFWASVNKAGPVPSHDATLGPCWVWTAACNRDGYGVIKPGGGKRQVKAHRVSLEWARGPIPDGQMVLHRCDNPPCVSPDHLYVGDAQQNARDAVARGRTATGERSWASRHPESIRRGERHWSRFHPGKTARGERHGRHKLTAAQVTEIRERYAAAPTRGAFTQLGLAFGVNRSQISSIVRGKAWRGDVAR